MLRHESHVPVHVALRITLVAILQRKSSLFLVTIFEKIGEMTTATSATSMTSPDRVAAPCQNHREGTGSWANDDPRLA
jgi:hypothetical protein